MQDFKTMYHVLRGFDMYMEFVGFVFVTCFLHEMCFCMVAEYSLLSLFVRNMYDFASLRPAKHFL